MAPSVPTATPENRRQRQRRELTLEITNEARRQLDAGGSGAVSWRAIARTVGMSPASLYTYFDSLDQLFTELLLQSYGRLRDAVEQASAAFADAPVGDRLLVGPLAYRRWALHNRAQFNLIFTDQLPGYAAPAGGPTVAAQVGVFRPMVEALIEARGGEFDETAMATPSPARDSFLGLWAMFHGLTSLEVNNHLDWVDAASIYEDRVRWYLNQLELPVASPSTVDRFAKYSSG